MIKYKTSEIWFELSQVTFNISLEAFSTWWKKEMMK